jgi:hypothetical protein
MGSSGSGRFSDYPGKPPKKISSSGGRGGTAGGSSGEDPCDRAFSTELEDFEFSEYFKKHGTAPKIGTSVTIEKGKRIVARTKAGETLGNLPTKFNYLAGCIAGGRAYAGHVIAVSDGLFAKVTIDAAPK